MKKTLKIFLLISIFIAGLTGNAYQVNASENYDTDQQKVTVTFTGESPADKNSMTKKNAIILPQLGDVKAFSLSFIGTFLIGIFFILILIRKGAKGGGS